MVEDDPKEIKEAERNLKDANRLYWEAAEAYTRITGIQRGRGSHVRIAPAEEFLAEQELRIKNRTALIILELASHTLVLVLSLGSIYLTGWVLKTLLGPNPKFFDFIPIHWIIDAADIAVIGKFIWETIKSFRK